MYDRIFHGLADANRIRILRMLGEQELSAGEILEKLDIVQSTLSHHMKALTESELVLARRDGKKTIYRINAAQLENAEEFLRSFLHENTAELQMLSEISGTDPNSETIEEKGATKADPESEGTAASVADRQLNRGEKQKKNTDPQKHRKAKKSAEPEKNDKRPKDDKDLKAGRKKKKSGKKKGRSKGAD